MLEANSLIPLSLIAVIRVQDLQVLHKERSTEKQEQFACKYHPQNGEQQWP